MCAQTLCYDIAPVDKVLNSGDNRISIHDDVTPYFFKAFFCAVGSNHHNPKVDFAAFNYISALQRQLFLVFVCLFNVGLILLLRLNTDARG